MWTERQVVADILKNENYCAIGNLYSSAGISAMIRNVYANPHLRKIVLWGADLSRSGQALMALMENGVDNNFFIIGDEKKGQIEKEIGKEAIDLFRKSVDVVNLRGKSPDELKKTVGDLDKTHAVPFAEPKIFPTTRPKPLTYPSEQIGVRLHGKKTAQVWLKILNNILRYGRNKTTRYAQENELKELLNIVAVITDEDPEKPYLPHFFPFTEKDLTTYYPQVLSAKQIPGIAYTYGQRLRAHDGVDQILNIIDLIKTRLFKKAVGQNRRYDLNRDKTINVGDVIVLGKFFNKGCPFQFLNAGAKGDGVEFSWKPGDLTGSIVGYNLTKNPAISCESGTVEIVAVAFTAGVRSGQSYWTWDKNAGGDKYVYGDQYLCFPGR